MVRWELFCEEVLDEEIAEGCPEEDEICGVDLEPNKRDQGD